MYLDTKNSQIEESSSEIELLKQSIGSKKEMEEEKQFKNIEYSKILDRNNEEIEELRKQIEILNEQITAKNQRVMDLSKDNKNYLEEIKEEKKKLLNTEKPLAKLEQFKKLYKKFVLQIKPHIEWFDDISVNCLYVIFKDSWNLVVIRIQTAFTIELSLVQIYYPTVDYLILVINQISCSTFPYLRGIAPCIIIILLEGWDLNNRTA